MQRLNHTLRRKLKLPSSQFDKKTERFSIFKTTTLALKISESLLHMKRVFRLPKFNFN